MKSGIQNMVDKDLIRLYFCQLVQKIKKTEMISGPRDTHAEIVGKDTEEKINHAYAYGWFGYGSEICRKAYGCPN